MVGTLDFKLPLDGGLFGLILDGFLQLVERP
jgi:hypothetical protein